MTDENKILEEEVQDEPEYITLEFEDGRQFDTYISIKTLKRIEKCVFFMSNFQLFYCVLCRNVLQYLVYRTLGGN